MAAAAQESRPRQRPGWMSIPGGPKEPNFQEFRNKITALNAQRSKLFDQLKEIQARAGPRDDSERDSINQERKVLRERMNDIDAKRKSQRDARSAKNDEIARIRRQRTEIEGKLKELSNELGAFRELSDIEMAIDHIMIKMETGGGGLASEKRTIKRLSALEEAKSLLLQLQPLQEAIADADDREAALQQEYREIHERIGQLNKEYEENFNVKQSMSKDVQKNQVDRTAIIKEREACREKLNKTFEEMNALREAYNAQQAAWNTWREEAQKKYAEKVEAERKEREMRWMERQNAEKIARKKARALKRQNPHELEINACTTLIHYLKDRLHMSQRDEEDRKRRAAMANFDAAASAPSGFALAEPLVPAKSKKASAKPDKTNKVPESKERLVHHSEDKQQLFKRVNVEAPSSIAAIEKAIEQLRSRQVEFESHIKAGELALSSDDETEEVEESEQTAQA